MEPTTPRRNIELKARLASIDTARDVAKSLATEHLGTRTQIDTYFCCSVGRLKLRESQGDSAELCGAQLVSYERADETEAKASDYRLLTVDDPEQLKKMLAETLGVKCVVEKRRDVYLHHNVRIHLDEVTSLGSFLEFEAVLSEGITNEQGHEQVAQLTAAFEISEADRLQGSYSDMITEQRDG